MVEVADQDFFIFRAITSQSKGKNEKIRKLSKHS